MTLAIRNARLLTADGVVETDLLIDGDRVVKLGFDLVAEDDFDARGAWVGPGLVDLHVHFREPGQEWKEDLTSGSAAAARGGFTAVVMMPNTVPALDAAHLVSMVIARSPGLCQLAVAGALTKGREGLELAHLDDLWEAGVRFFSDDGTSVADAGLLRTAMEYLAERGGVVAQHAEDPGLSRGGHMHEGSVSSRLGVGGIPAAAEEVVLARDLTLAKLTGVRYHAQHLSSAGSVALVEAAKKAGLPVTAEVTPHHLAFDHRQTEALDPAYKMYPPLRSETDRTALRSALATGIIDAVATDHAPHADFETEVPFAEAPRGVIGLETAVAAVLTATELDQETLFERMSIVPARIAGMTRQGQPVAEGVAANLVVIDPRATSTVTHFSSRSSNSPFKGASLRGRVLATVYEGRLLVAS